MAGTLAKKVALVTGGASGIGRAAALAFAREGALVVVSDVAVEGGEETARLCAAKGAEARFVGCDVSKTADVDALVRKTVDAFGRLDCAFNNAGIEGILKPLVDYPEETFERVLAINLTGVWRCMRAEIPVMQRTGGGAIVNTASVAGLVGAATFGAYVASKHGVVGLTKVAALENATAGIRVNAVCPGVIQTPMLDRIAAGTPDLVSALAASAPIGRLGKAEEIAEAVVWLCSPAASFVTGAALPADGGYVAQ